MSGKFIKGIILITLVVAALYTHAPQKALDWVRSYHGGGEEYLPGPLRGLLDPNVNSVLTVTGVVQATNEQRQNNGGFAPLHVNPKLTAAAEGKIDDMFAKQYFEHESPDGKSPADIIRGQGYEYIVVGENLALGNFADDQTLVQAWMDSPGHRANILNDKYDEIGVAVRKGTFEGKEVWLAVQEFGAPLSSCPSPSKSLKAEIDSNRTSIASLQSELQQQKSNLKNDHYESQSDYNAAVARYNALAKRINELSDATQSLVAQYNDQVNAFNKCLESNS